MNLSEIMQAAQGGQGVDNLAAQFGLSPEQTQAAIQAVIPAFSKGLQGAAQDPAGLGGILSHLAGGAHDASYTDPGQASAASNQGGNVLGQIFGSSGVTGQISQQASRISGVDPATIQQMMPVIATMLMGGLTHMMNRQGLGGVLGQLANTANSPGGIGSATYPEGAPPRSGGLLGGLFSSVIGALTGGGPAGATSESAAIQTGLNALIGMLHPGVEAPPEHLHALDDIMNPGKQAAQN
jgi:hypothetical protein